MSRLLPIESTLKFAWEKTKQHYWVILGISLLSVVLQVGLSVTGGSFNSSPNMAPNESFSMSFGANIVGLVVGTVISVVATKALLAIIDGNYAGISQAAKQPFELYLKAFFATILYTLIVILGLVALIIPGIYLAIKYQFYANFIVDKNVGIAESFTLSGKATKGIKWQLIGYGLVFAIINLLGMLLLGLGLFVTIPVSTVAYQYIYRQISTVE